MATVFVSLIAGVLFGAGLAVSQMVSPAKILAFLDLGRVASGTWDPSLAFVMGGALVVTAAGYALARRRGRPLLGSGFALPAPRGIDTQLMAGAAIFGLGWGLAGYCPGPAIASLIAGVPGTAVFLAAMIAGMALHRLHLRPPAPAQATG
jgi:uncharacterized membrane protein YedE/YeeE